MPIKIYKAEASPPSRAVLMIAEILKLKFETQEINRMADEHKKPEYLEKNPLHTTPLLEDEDFILADSHAINTYLVSKYGADKRGELYPNDLNLRATIDQRLYFDATILFPAFGVLVTAIIHNKVTGPNEQGTADANRGYNVLDKYLEKTRFVACDYLTLADVSIVASISSLEVIVPIEEKYINVHRWLNRLKDEEWYQKANVPGLIQLTHILNVTIEKNRAEVMNV